MTDRLSRAALGVLPAVAVLAAVAAPVAAEIEGIWLVENGEAKIKVQRCADDVCGRIVWLSEPTDSEGNVKRDILNPDRSLRDRTVIDVQLFRIPAVPDKRGVWSGGRIYDPDTGKTHRCTLRLDGERLKLRGYIGIRLFGRSTYWTRTTL